MTAYATVPQYEQYAGRPSPDDIERLLERASTTVAHAIRVYVGVDDNGQPAKHVDTIRDAVCAQVEYWIATSERVDITDDAEDPPLAPRAERLLATAGLRNPTVPA